MQPTTPGHLHREYVLSPITALAFYTSLVDNQQYLLAGEDTDIKVYHVQTSHFCGQLPVFQAQSIHGITVPPADVAYQSRLILVWGGPSVRVLSRDLIEDLISGDGRKQDLSSVPNVAETKAPDWIFDGRVSPFGDDRVVLLTAHNEVIQAHVDPGRNRLVFDSIQSPSRPILYSGNFFWVSKECVLVAAGTVFGEIIVWKCFLGTAAQEQTCEVLFVFTGHEGSIFGVHISPEIQISSGETKRLLASCSDDRTIRVWDITENDDDTGPEKQVKHKNHISDARETGFGNNATATAHDGHSTRCLATVMGHASRIWQVEFPQRQPLSRTAGIVELYSFGEDATAQKWNLSLNLPPSEAGASISPSLVSAAKLTHQSTFSNHSGKHIWSHSMTTNGDNVLIATGGADGKVAIIGAGMEDSSPIVTGSDQRKAVPWSLPDVLRSSNSAGAVTINDGSSSLVSLPPSIKPKNAKEAFNRYTFISDRRLLAATNSGRIFIGAFEDELTWTELVLPDEIGQIVFSHSLLGGSVANSMALVGTNTGDIYYYSESGARPLQLLTKVDGKVADIFCLSDGGTRSSDNHLEFLVTILRSAEAVIIRVDPNNLDIKQTKVTLDPGFMVTAATFIRGHLILGSRKGIITVLKGEANSDYCALFNIEVHLDDAITSILPLHTRGDHPHNYILSTCRDGKYRIHDILTNDAQPSATLIHEILPPFVSSVEGAWFSETEDGTKDLMLCGFRSKNFVVWNETQRYEVATVDCGGSSRSYAWTPIRCYSDGFRFVFTKAGQMHVFSQTLAPHKTLKTGGHGREIKAVSASTGRYIATAAEDTVIRIWEYGRDHRGQDRDPTSDKFGLRCVAALERHATGIQALKWYKDEYLFSSGGNEEFFVWKINQLENCDFSGLAVMCEAVFPDRSEVGDARITDFDVTCAGRSPEGAYRFCISMALSNSTLQTYEYTARAGFRLFRRSTYTGACLTQVRHLGDSYVLTAATDGYLAIYASTEKGAGSGAEANSESSPIKPIITKLHQNTIKSLDVRQIATASNEASAEYLIVTGGDDNALGIMHIRCPDPSLFPAAEAVTINSKSIIRSAHAAAVTGIAITRLEGDGAVIVTGSNDQRVRVWRLIGRQKLRPRAELLDERYSAIADTGSLDVFGCEDASDGKREKVIVVGVGIEVWELRC
ncbi:WD40 repeat-like protein [Hypomontagnella monticulosa]|nr:WD40 repeat-like protein [Hypomontagnella monticulosa]